MLAQYIDEIPYKQIEALLTSGQLKVQMTGNGGGQMSFLFGTGAPQDSQGENGDLYLNTNNGDFYQKGSGTWSKKANLEGPQGPQGPKGPKGPQGPPGEGVPKGGKKGQVLAKASDQDYDTKWVNDQIK